MALEIIKKAWNVWHNGMIGYGPEIYNSPEETPIVYAKTASEAKSNSSEWKDWDLEGDDPTWTDLKVKRAMSADIVIFEGKEMKRYYVQSLLFTRKREAKLKSFLDDPVLTHCYILKRGTYYRPNSSGYTSMKHRAGIYTIKEGVEDAISCQELWLERTSKEEHNAMLQKHIEETQQLILN